MFEVMDMTLGNRIAFLRKQQGLTQEALAQKLEVTNQAVSKWESDACCPDITLLPKLADVFGVTIDELFGREPKEAPVMEEQADTVKDALDTGMDALSRGMDVLGKILGSGKAGTHKKKDFSYEKTFRVSLEELEQEAKQKKDSWRFHEVDWSQFDTAQGNWEDDGILRVVLFAGRRLIMGAPIAERIDFHFDGPAQTIYSQCNVVCDSVGGHVYAGGDVTCDDVQGDIHAEGSVTCDCVEGGVIAGGTVTCDEINGATVRSHHDIECDELNECTVYAEGDLRCEEINGGSIEYKGRFSTN